MLLPEGEVGLTIDLGRPLLGSKEVVEEQLVELLDVLTLGITGLDESNLTFHLLDFSGTDLNFHGSLIGEGLDGRGQRPLTVVLSRLGLPIVVGVRSILVLRLES